MNKTGAGWNELFEHANGHNQRAAFWLRLPRETKEAFFQQLTPDQQIAILQVPVRKQKRYKTQVKSADSITDYCNGKLTGPKGGRSQLKEAKEIEKFCEAGWIDPNEEMLY